MAAPKTVKTYPLNGSSRDFEIPFEYLARKFVQVSLIGQDKRVLILNIDYRFTQRTIITTTQAWGPAQGYDFIEIRRVTSATERLVDFSDGSILRASDLNTSQVQALHIAEEGRDIATDTIGVDNNGQLDARGRQIKNVANGTADGDAVNMRQMKAFDGSALNSAKAAKTSETNAKASETAAKASQTAAANSQSAAASSAANAAASATNAKTSETSAKTSENLAKDWATKLTGPVAGGLYSAQYWAGEAQKSNVAAQGEVTKAKAEVTKAQAEVTKATQQADRAKTEADRAKTEADKLGNANAFMATIDTVVANGVRWKPEVTLYAKGFQAFHPTSTSEAQCLHDYNGMYRQGPVRVMATTGNVDITASTGYARLLSGANGGGISVTPGNMFLNTPGDGLYVGIQGTKPLLRLVTTANKQCAYFAAYGEGSATLAVYNTAGTAARAMTMNYDNTILSWNGALTIAGNLSGVANATVTGTVAAGTFRGDGAALTNVPATPASVFAALQTSAGGNLGCYSFMRNKSNSNFGLNGVTTGSNLQYSSHNSQGTAVPPGSWRCMSQGNSGSASVWLRYA